jgi:antitoxin ParD1/3/4
MPARNVNLTNHLAQFVDSNVETGQFQNASEVVREGLRLLEQRQSEDALKLDALRAAIEVGREDVRQGRVIRIEPGREAEFVAGLGRTASRGA